MTICVFLGPTLDKQAAAALLTATYLPPVRQGDVIRAIDEYEPSVIGIIDGFFEQTPAVWHKEILWALHHGIGVYGASSMGALRAAELDPFGMVGVGKIYEAYRDGVFAPFDGPFEDDDEVAVSHGPADLGYPGSTALVDIRSTLAAASEGGLIDGAMRDRLALLAKAIFYKERTYDSLFAAAAEDGIDEQSLTSLKRWIADGNAVEQKRLDAKQLLSTIGSLEFTPSPANFRFEHTIVWETALAGSAPSATE